MPEQQIDGNVSGAESALADVEERLAVVERHLAQAQRLGTLGTLAAGIAHEINNILTPVLSYAHLASSRRDDPEFLDKALGKIVRGVESATDVARAMLTYSRDDDTGETANLQATLDAAIGSLGREPAKDGIAIDVDLPPEAFVSIPPLSLQQVLVNLLLNAGKAMGRGGGRIMVSARSADGRTVLRFADTGPGIPEAILPSLFEPFVGTGAPVESGDDEVTQGHGLGLAVCRLLIENAGGTIEASSPSSGGAVFTIALPEASAPAAKAG